MIHQYTWLFIAPRTISCIAIWIKINCIIYSWKSRSTVTFFMFNWLLVWSWGFQMFDKAEVYFFAYGQTCCGFFLYLISNNNEWQNNITNIGNNYLEISSFSHLVGFPSIPTLILLVEKQILLGTILYIYLSMRKETAERSWTLWSQLNNWFSILQIEMIN